MVSNFTSIVVVGEDQLDVLHLRLLGHYDSYVLLSRLNSIVSTIAARRSKGFARLYDSGPDAFIRLLKPWCLKPGLLWGWL